MLHVRQRRPLSTPASREVDALQPHLLGLGPRGLQREPIALTLSCF